MKVLRIVVVAAILVGGATAATWADDDRAIVAFGQGVHAYFDRHYDIANKLLSEAIEASTADPRPYFFRGLVRQSTGQTQLAGVDFEKGAEVELSFVGRSYDVDDSLERIQGPVRIEIEKYRREAAVRAKELGRAANSEVDQSGPSLSPSPGAPLDPRNLPDVSQIVDATIPYPEISANPYFPPAKSAAEAQNSNVQPAAKDVQPQGPPPAAADDPFNTGNKGDKAGDAKPMKDQADSQDSKPADNPFNSNDQGGGAEKSDSKKDGADSPDPKPGDGSQPEPKDDPFGGG